MSLWWDMKDNYILTWSAYLLLRLSPALKELINIYSNTLYKCNLLYLNYNNLWPNQRNTIQNLQKEKQLKFAINLK